MELKIDEIVRSKRRTISLEVTRDARLVVHAPLKTSKAAIDNAVEQKRGWVQRKLDDARRRDAKYPPKKCSEGETFELLGKAYILCFEDGASAVSASGGRLIAPCVDKVDVRSAITAWYKAQAGAVLLRRTEYYAKLAGVSFKSLKITSALSRWGLCSGSGGLCFTWRLVMAPVEMIDYVVVHELSHIGHPDHSREFWRRVGELMPDYAVRREWFRQNAALLRHDFYA